MKKFCRRTKRTSSSVMTLLAAALDLSLDAIPAIKPRSGRPPKTSKDTDDVLRQQLGRNPQLSASGLKEIHQDHLVIVTIRFIEHRLMKNLKVPSRARPPNFPDST